MVGCVPPVPARQVTVEWLWPSALRKQPLSDALLQSAEPQPPAPLSQPVVVEASEACSLAGAAGLGWGRGVSSYAWSKTELTSGRWEGGGRLTWTFFSLFRTVACTVCSVEFEIGDGMGGGMGRLVSSVLR